MFKDIKVGDTLYLLDIDPTTGVPSYKEVTADKVVPEYATQNAAFQQVIVMDMVIKYPGSEGIELSKIDSSMTSLAVGRYKLGCTKLWAMNEIRNMHDTYKNHIASVDDYKSIEAACASILEANGLNCASDSERLKLLETSMSSVTSEVSEMKSMLSEFITNFKPSNNGKAQRGPKDNNKPEPAATSAPATPTASA